MAAAKPKMGHKPGMGKGKPGMTRLRTVWITEPSQNSFKEDYDVIKQIGEPGQFGKAFQCKPKLDGKILAVKEISKARIYRLHPSDNIRQSLLKSMQSEIDIMRRLNHKYIVNMFGTYETKHDLHIVMEECRGGELFDRIKKKRRYPEADAKPIIRMVCEALFHMHDKHRVVHCDLKPDNILFVTEAEDSPIKIIDFGMSKVLPRLRSLRELCGTPYYTAPEIINGEYSHAADMWSVGVISYVMIFGFPPFYVDPNKYYGVKETKEIYKLILKGFDPQVKKGYGAWFPKPLEKKLGSEGRDFMALLMSKDQAKRMTAKEALQHPWLTGKGVALKDVDDESASVDVADADDQKQHMVDLTGLQFANFATSHKFKFAITALFRDQYKNMRPKHFENLKNLFSELDKDKNGKISFEEFKAGMLKAKDLNLDEDRIKTMFEEMDVSHQGEIEFGNLLNAAVHDYLIASDVRLYKAFRDLDENETGKIQTKVLKNKIREMNPYGNVDMLLQIIDDVDLDNDGTIDYEEFLRALHPDFNETPNWFWEDEKNQDESDDEEGQIDDAEDSKGSEEEEDMDVHDPNDAIDQDVLEHATALGSTDDDLGKKPKMVLKEGYMRKEGKMVKSWKRRYFKLQKNGVMSYYHNNQEDAAIGKFNVKDMTKLMNKSWSKSNKRRFGIKVYTPHRNWKFLCADNKERIEWLGAFEIVSGRKAGNKATD